MKFRNIFLHRIFIKNILLKILSLLYKLQVCQYTSPNVCIAYISVSSYCDDALSIPSFKQSGTCRCTLKENLYQNSNFLRWIGITSLSKHIVNVILEPTMIPPTGDTQPFAILISGATGSKYNQRERESWGGCDERKWDGSSHTHRFVHSKIVVSKTLQQVYKHLYDRYIYTTGDTLPPASRSIQNILEESLKCKKEFSETV